MLRCVRCGFEFVGSAWKCPSCNWTAIRQGAIIVATVEKPKPNPGFDPTFFEQLFELESGSFWFRARNELIQWSLKRHFPNARSFLEVGCGTGFVLSGLTTANPNLEVTGTELYIEGLTRTAQRVRRAAFVQADARCIPFTSEFDVIGAFDVLEHVDEDEVVLAEIHRALKSGGGAILTVPQHRWLWSAADTYAYHQRRYTRSELKAKLNRAGLQVLRCTSFVTLLLPLMLASRLQQRSLKTFDPRAEFTMAGWLNRTLEWVMKVERALIARGLSLPAGGSLLAVAAKPPAR